MSTLTVTNLLDADYAIISECISIIIQHNINSYKSIPVPNAERPPFTHKTNNLFNLQLIEFFNKFSVDIRFAQLLQTSISQMTYDTEEMMMQLNRSPDYIFNLEKLLSNQKQSLIVNHDRLKKTHPKIIQKYCEYVKDNISTWEIDPSSLIDILFKLIHFDFGLVVGIRLILSLFHSLDMLNDDQSRIQIKVLTEQLKLKCLGYTKLNDTFQSKSTHFQTYNLIPSTNNQSLSQIFEQLFATKINTLSINNLELNLRIISKNLKKTVAIVIIAKNNNDFYFDIDTLFDRERLQSITSSNGVSKEYIDIFETLRTTVLPKHIENSISSYNYIDADETYMLWTNDMINFKLREQPVDHLLINKILKESSSALIDIRNKRFEELILNKIKEDTLVSFKQIKYLSFEVENEERVFIDKVCGQISKYLKHKLKDSRDALFSPTFIQEIINIFQSEFKSFKPFHTSKHMPLQPLLIYTNASIQLSNRIKKDVMGWNNKDGSLGDIDSIVKIIIDSNDNLYSKFISSYYLAMSAFK